jgi:hypothetical protein
MTRDDLHFRLRIPEGLKSRLKKVAFANERSLTAEINARLEMSFMIDAVGENVDPDDVDLIDMLADMERLKQKLVRLRRPSK